MQVTDNVYALDSTRGNYAYLITGDEAVLVDAGRPDQQRRILRELLAMGVQPEQVRHILLTHHDIDHVGGAAFLQQATGSRVWASEQDSPYIAGRHPRPGIKRIIETVFRPKTPHNLNLYAEATVAGVEVIPTPGHTPGHVCLLYQDVLFVGDLLHVVKGIVAPYPAFWNWDNAALKESVRKIAPLPFKWICPAHGSPIKKDALLEIL